MIVMFRHLIASISCLSGMFGLHALMVKMVAPTDS